MTPDAGGETWVAWGRESGVWWPCDWGPDRDLLARKAPGYPLQPIVILPAGQRPETHSPDGRKAHAD
jgi:hypothetical protein